MDAGQDAVHDAVQEEEEEITLGSHSSTRPKDQERTNKQDAVQENSFSVTCSQNNAAVSNRRSSAPIPDSTSQIQARDVETMWRLCGDYVATTWRL